MIEGAIVLAIIAAVGGLAIWLVGIGKDVGEGDEAKKKLKGRKKFDETLERWKGLGGLGAARRRARERKRRDAGNNPDV